MSQREQASTAEWEVHETDLEIVEPVNIFELGRHAGKYRIESGVDYSSEEENAGGFFLEENN